MAALAIVHAHDSQAFASATTDPLLVIPATDSWTRVVVTASVDLGAGGRLGFNKSEASRGKLIVHNATEILYLPPHTEVWLAPRGATTITFTAIQTSLPPSSYLAD